MTNYEYGFMHRSVTDADRLGKAIADRSALLGRAWWDDTLSGTIEETWPDTTHLTMGSPGLVASGGNLVAAASPGVGSGATINTVSVAVGEVARAQCIFVKEGAQNGGAMVGVSTDALGVTPANTAANARALYFQTALPTTWIAGVQTTITAPDSAPPNGTYLVTIEVGASYVSVIAALTTDSNIEYRMKVARPAGALTFYFFNSDNGTVGVNSKYFGKFSVKKGPVSGRRTFGLSTLGRSVIGTKVGNADMKIELPVGYDSRVPTPVIMAFHGSGTDEHTFSDLTAQRPAHKAFIDAGFIIATACYTPQKASWGIQQSLDAYYALYQYLIANYNIGPIVFYCNSMGGIESLLCLNEDRIKGVVGWIGTSPTYDLAACYAGFPGGTAWQGTIDGAYGITGTGGNTYALLTAGHDPALMLATAFRSVPMMILAASDDTSISKTQNGDALYNKVLGTAKEVTNVAGITGGHTFNLTSYTASMLAFAQKCAGV